MTMKYDKMFKLLELHGYNPARVRKEKLMGQATYWGLKNGTTGIDHRTIESVCKTLHCQPGDLMEYVEDE